MLTYIRLSDYLQKAFRLAPSSFGQPAEKIYKLALSAGTTCPNRDGTCGEGGCIFCSAGGSGDFASDARLSVSEQIEQAKELLRRKAPNARYIAYFQSFTSTYVPASVLAASRMEKSSDFLRPLFTEAVQHPEVAVLSVATRPDCLPDDVLDMLEELNRIKPVWVELGLQTIHPDTAKYIRRGYDLPVFDRAVSELHRRGISVIVHLILGLPGETKEDMVKSASYVSGVLRSSAPGTERKASPLSSISANRISSESRDLPDEDRDPACPRPCLPSADGIKFQLLHVLKGTGLAADFEAGKFRTLEMDEYFDILSACIRAADPSLVMHRVTGDGPKKDLIAPLWSGNKKMVLNAWKQYCRTH